MFEVRVHKTYIRSTVLQYRIYMLKSKKDRNGIILCEDKETKL